MDINRFEPMAFPLWAFIANDQCTVLIQAKTSDDILERIAVFFTLTFHAVLHDPISFADIKRSFVLGYVGRLSVRIVKTIPEPFAIQFIKADIFSD